MGIGMHVEAAHHEVAAAGQCEIDFRFGGMLETADALGWYKYIVRNVAKQHGKSATFMPKPLLGDSGSGMHQHYSLHDASGKNLFTGDGPAGLSEMALYFIGGIIKHADSILAFTNPGTNSYKRLVPGFEAPIFAAYSGRNRSAFCRIPVSHPKGRRVEFRTPDPTGRRCFHARCHRSIRRTEERRVDRILPTAYTIRIHPLLRRIMCGIPPQICTPPRLVLDTENELIFPWLLGTQLTTLSILYAMSSCSF